MVKKSRSFQKRIGSGFFMNGPITSGGLTYKELIFDQERDIANHSYNINLNTNEANTRNTLY